MCRNCYLITCHLLLVLSLPFASCRQKQSLNNPVFTVLESDKTGISFTNKLTPTPEFNLFSYMYYYNGAGVAAADFNNDGLADLFFCANLGENKMYVNKGALRFEDITKQTLIPQDGAWSTGVSVVDINNDGMLDLYICRVGNYKILKGRNQLLICQGINNGLPVYKDEAPAYGLDFSGFSTQAAFFDYDLDGDLDMFLLNHSVNHDGNYAPRKLFLNTYDSLAGQKLFRNDCKNGTTAIHFTDVTRQSGINGSRIGYGLGVTVSDINLDGWPDFYVGNDFHENDYLYINQKNGTFKDESTTMLMHTSQFSMGVDVADITNDGYPEIISMDMLPYDPYILRRSLAQDDYTIFLQKLSFGYSYQYARNNLQLNRRNGMFTEIGQYANVYASDWSWAPLFVDLNNDGNKDLFISNGIPKRMNDIDYVNYVSSEEMQQKFREHHVQDKDMELIEKFPEIKIPNKFYINEGQASYKEITDSIANNKSTYSNGAVYADLDNDGDLDIVVNNIDDPALIYKNNQNDLKTKPAAEISLKGDSNNINAIGAKIVVFVGNNIRTYENSPVRGFQSSMSGPVHIGLYHTQVDSAFIIWPDNTFQPLTVTPGEQKKVTYTEGLPVFKYEWITSWYKNPSLPLEDITAQTGIQFTHTENPFNEFNREPLIPHMLSAEGPALAVTDIDHDGLEDIFIGASKTFHNAVWKQLPGGRFKQIPQPGMAADSMWENVSAVWADVNQDTHPDLIIASGGNEYYGSDRHLLPLLYLNDGSGHLTKKMDAFTNIYTTQSVVVSADINNDGVPDLFIGSRAVPWNYGQPCNSYLLQNDGSGRFTDVTERYVEKGITGMVTNAVFNDINGDKRPDLVVCYQWGGIDAFINNGKKFEKKAITEKNGWWDVVIPIDIDGDGDMDFIAGNLGLNTPLKATAEEPVRMYYNDFDDNGKKEQLITYYLSTQEIPFATKMDLEKQVPALKKKYLYAEAFAKAKISDLFGNAKLKDAEKYTADYLVSTIFLNDGSFNFKALPLPYQAQLSSIRDMMIVDANKDALPDILIAANDYYYNTQIGRLDGDPGTLLINKGNGNFIAALLNSLTLSGQTRRLQPIHINGKPVIIAAKNDGPLQILHFKD